MKIDFKFYAITDRKRLAGDRFLYHIEKACASGLKAIQIREKDLTPLELYRLCEKIRSLTQRYKTKIIVNDRVDIMLGLDLEGVHLTENSLPVGQVRTMIGNEKFIGVSVHSAEKLQEVFRASADFAVLGPVAATASKPAGHRIMPPEEFNDACSKVTMPVFALGGIGLDTVSFWLDRGAKGVAGISLWMDAPDIGAQLKQLEKLLKHL